MPAMMLGVANARLGEARQRVAVMQVLAARRRAAAFDCDCVVASSLGGCVLERPVGLLAVHAPQTPIVTVGMATRSNPGFVGFAGRIFGYTRV